MLRWVPGELSTKQSRAHGLAVLSKFLNGTDNTKYPGPAIPTLDCTNESDPHALDMFFLDKDIVDIIQRVFDESDLNKDFYSTYKSLALKLWSGENYPEYARGLGFP